LIVRELELDLDAFEGPFDLLLTLVLKEELPLAEVDVAGIIVAFVERLADHATRPVSPPALQRSASAASADAIAADSPTRPQLDLEACGEFLVLVSALLELKARALFPDEDAELADLEPEEAAEELARRLLEYRRAKEAAAWLGERLAEERHRFFRLGPAPLAPQPELRLARQDPAQLAAVVRALAAEPPTVSLGHLELRFPPLSQFLERFRAVLRRRRRFDFDHEVGGLSRIEQAVALLALLELRKADEVKIDQAVPFGPIRVVRESGASHEVVPLRPTARLVSGA
jgi:segregation and condensation protein A